eukprot:m.212738 g.212738  ORF g.212738 m.212738 type:complete len:728 (-) comp15857_c0_seq6:1059-3242(-)
MFGSAILVAMVTLTTGRDELCYMHHGWALQTTQLSEVLAELNLYHIAKVGSMEHFHLVAHKELFDTSENISLCNTDISRAQNQEKATTHALLSHPHVVWSSLQIQLERARRTLLNLDDPLLPQQWYYNENGGTEAPIHFQQASLWKHGINGSGVVITIVDDGLSTDHPEIAENYDAMASHNFNPRKKSDPHYGDNNSPYPDESKSINSHGTSCGGVAAGVANNSFCGVGAAFSAKIGGIRMLDGGVTDGIEASSLSWKPEHVDIYSCSWGPNDDGKTTEGPGELAQKALRDGTSTGRDSLGSVFVWASGNGGQNYDQCNCDGYANNPYTIAVAAVGPMGEHPSYGELCTAILTTTPSRGLDDSVGLVSSSLHKTCTTNFGGTSAAAPLASGIVALALQVNPCLSWRDVQNLIVEASSPILEQEDKTEFINGVGKVYSLKYGFGMLSATKLVENSTSWTPVSSRIKLSATKSAEKSSVTQYTSSIDLTGCDETGDICVRRLEHVTLTVDMTVSVRGSVVVVLESPQGTLSLLQDERPLDTSKGKFKWTFTTVACWGENPAGSWGLTIDGKSFVMHSWSIAIYGTDDYSMKIYEPITPSRKLSNGCVVCDKASFPDGKGKCIPCSSSCSEGCVGMGPAGCIVSGGGKAGIPSVELFIMIGAGSACLLLVCCGVAVYMGSNGTSKSKFKRIPKEFDDEEDSDLLITEPQSNSQRISLPMQTRTEDILIIQ